MANSGFIALDTKAFNAVRDTTDKLVSEYDKIKTDYDSIVNTLLENWKGRGADAFRDDATKVKTNIGGIYDILKTMCDTLKECEEVFAEKDRALGDYTSNPFSE
jgi:WXG100 family type VII secretion target